MQGTRSAGRTTSKVLVQIVTVEQHKRFTGTLDSTEVVADLVKLEVQVVKGEVGGNVVGGGVQDKLAEIAGDGLVVAAQVDVGANFSGRRVASQCIEDVGSKITHDIITVGREVALHTKSDKRSISMCERQRHRSRGEPALRKSYPDRPRARPR